MKSSFFTFICLMIVLTFYSFVSFAAMNTQSSKNSFYIRQNKQLNRIEIQSKNGEWYAASKQYSGNNNDFWSRISLNIQNGKVYILSVTGEKIISLNAGLHYSVTAMFDLILEWENNNLYIWGDKIGGKDTIANCERIMISYERIKNKHQKYRVFRAIVVLRTFANKIQIKDVRTKECNTCWCHVHKLIGVEPR